MTSNILIYQTEDGQTKIETVLQDETVWLTQAQLCELFQKSKSTISEHIKNIFMEGELLEDAVVRKFRTTAEDGKNYNTNFYNLDIIISVGYRVKSHQGTKFRQWATLRLREYIVKGFTMNDELLKEAGGGNYFEELLQRIRDIRSSEKIFWRKVLDIYATSIDYDPKAELSIRFFQTIQNKMHWATHGKTAAEVIHSRADGDKAYMGLTTFKGEQPLKKEVEIAKNYLSEDELNILNRLVTAYLEIAELQAMNSQPMYMRNWLEKIDDFLKMTGNSILSHAGKISHQQAIEKAHGEYRKYKLRTENELTRVERDFIENIETVAKSLKNKKGKK
jgi:hypothetical protein